jgi:hypothetical protein
MNQVQAQYHADKGDEFEESILQFKELIEMKFNASDKIKVARIIAGALGVSDVDKTSNPEQLVNNALRKIRNKPLRPEYTAVLNNMLTTAKEAGIEYDTKLVPGKVQEAKEAKYDGNYQDAVKRVGEKAKQGKMKTVWVPDKHGTGGRYKVVPVAEVKEQTEKPEVGDTGKVTFDTLKKVHGIQDVHKLKPSDNKSVGVPASSSELRVKHQRMHEEAEFEELVDADFDTEIHEMVDVEHIIEAYEDDEIVIIDEETGEELSTEGFDDSVESEAVMREGVVVILEISRMERIRRKQRFARTQSKREVRAQVALRKTSSTATISKRARRLATSMIKKRLLRKDAAKATLPEKERVEKFLASRKAIVDRLAKRVAPRIRQIEKARLQHKKAK